MSVFYCPVKLWSPHWILSFRRVPVYRIYLSLITEALSHHISCKNRTLKVTKKGSLTGQQSLKGWFFATLLSKTDFSFALLLVTFEPLEIYQSYIPFWKAQECGNNAWEAQGRGCMFMLRQTSVKMAVLLHKQANDWFHPLLTVCITYSNMIFYDIWNLRIFELLVQIVSAALEL